MNVAAVVVAAGSGLRLGRATPKALVELAGRTILARSLAVFDRPDITELVVVAPGPAVDRLRAEHRVTVVAGGPSRSESVRRGLAAVSERSEWVLIHDAARPLVPATVISNVIAELQAGAEAVIPVLPVADTVKRIDGHGVVSETVDREMLRRVQTPQGFRLDVLRAAYLAAPEAVHTDDAGVVEAYGVAVRTVPGDEEAFKITTPYDLELATRLVQDPPAPGGQA